MSNFIKKYEKQLNWIITSLVTVTTAVNTILYTLLDCAK